LEVTFFSLRSELGREEDGLSSSSLLRDGVVDHPAGASPHQHRISEKPKISH